MVALLLCASMYGGIGVQPAAATHDCNGTDMLIAATSAGFDTVFSGDDEDSINILLGEEPPEGVLGGESFNYDKCARNHGSGSVQEMKQLDAEQEWIDYYQGYATAHEEQRQEYLEAKRTYDNTDTTVWTRMQFVSNQEYKETNGNITESEYIQAGYAASNSFYGDSQVAVLESAETHMGDVLYQIRRAENESGINASETLNVALVTENGTIEQADLMQNETYSTELTNVTYQLEDGRTHTIGVLTVTNTDSGSTTILSPVDPKYVVNPGDYDGSFDAQYRDSWNASDGNTAGEWTRNDAGTALVALPPNDSSESKIVAYDPSMYNHEFHITNTYHNTLTDNYDPVASSMYQALENGTISPEEATPSNGYIDATDPRNAGSHWIYKVATLQSAGYETAKLNETGTMTMQYQGSNYTGLLVSENSPAGGWVVGTEYAASEINGTEMFVTTDGTTVDIQQNSTFTITRAEDKDGNEIGTVTTSQPVYKTYNNSEYMKLIDRVNDLAAEVESREPEGGGGGQSGGVSPLQAAVVVAVLLGAIWLANRRKDDDELPYRGGR